ncbi:MAG: hypothetical protein KHY61_10780, partial [Sutterella wadsworthensis]|nr:hypothetical protein [Sutterella wadsworthensis]
FNYNTKHPFFMPVNSEIFRIYRHLFYGSPLKTNEKARRRRTGGLFAALEMVFRDFAVGMSLPLSLRNAVFGSSSRRTSENYSML